jgi:2,3-dihydroxybiphenyl 1,2-dioxygenase
VISQLGYLGFDVSDPPAWRRFGTDVLGLALANDDGDAACSFRMDGHAHRLFVERGVADDLAFIGWECASAASFDATVARLATAGVETSVGSAEVCARRRVQRLVRFHDPNGLSTEVFHGPLLSTEDFRSPHVTSGFVADALGLGHIAVGVGDLERTRAFYCEVLGFRLSDRIVAEIHGHHADMLFLHTNPRHHSFAFGARQDKRLFHFMLEVRSMDDVGLAMDRTLRSGLRLTHTLGRHPNDRMFSFYARTPSGFQFEIGWGGREVDDASWVPSVHDRISEWGHHPPGVLAPRKPAPAAEAPR